MRHMKKQMEGACVRESATGEDDGVPFQNNWVYGVRPIVLLILSGRVMLKEFLS